MQFRDLKAQYEALKPEIDKGIQEVINSTAFILGKPVTELENKLAEYVGRKHCVGCANGTDALQLALMIWGIGPGDAVFTSDFTYFASAGTKSVTLMVSDGKITTSLTNVFDLAATNDLAASIVMAFMTRSPVPPIQKTNTLFAITICRFLGTCMRLS